MDTRYNLSELKEILWSFYSVSGIRFILFDDKFNKIISCPENDCEYCTEMRKCPTTARKCFISDRKAHVKCQTTNGAYIYKCHAGLVEASLALRQNESIVGYMMFGQVIDEQASEKSKKELVSYALEFGLDKAKISNAVESIKFMDSNLISSAAKILEALTSYIMLKELITPKNSIVFDKAKQYIDEHISEKISLLDICNTLNISRTKLYDVFSAEAKIGVSEYIKRRKMKKAKKLLLETEYPVWEIAQLVGYPDYTYFSKVYKSIYGQSPRMQRNKNG